MSNILKYKGYHAKVEFSAEERVFFGEVFGIEDSLNFYGETVSEIEGAFHNCIEEYLEMCKEFGKEPNRSFKGSFNVRVRPEMHRDAALAAYDKGITLNQYVEEALEKSLSNKNGQVTYMFLPSHLFPRTYKALSGTNDLDTSKYIEQPSGVNGGKLYEWK